MDTAKIEAGVRLILEGVGEDPEREGLRETPARVARMYEEVLGGLEEDPSRHFDVTFDEGHEEIVLVGDIPFFSMCEHHLAPFFGKAHVAYIPGEDGRICGISKLARLVDGFAKRPQVQERLTGQIADTLVEALHPGRRHRGAGGRAYVHVHARREEAGRKNDHAGRARLLRNRRRRAFRGAVADFPPLKRCPFRCGRA